jgi:hypothetical protein
VGNNIYIQGNIIVPNSGSHNITGNLVTTISTTGTSIVSGNETVYGTETIGGLLTASGGIVSYLDASFNNRVLVGSDVSLGGRLYVQGASIFTGTTQHTGLVTFLGVGPIMMGNNIQTGTIPSSAIVGGIQSGGSGVDLSTNQTINGVKTFGNIITASGGIVSYSDVSINTRIFVNGDSSMNGNLYIGKTLKPVNISEAFTTTSSSASSYTFDFSTGSTFYVSSPPALNFTCNFTNVPSDINRTYVITLIINSTTNKTFANSVQINSNTASTPNYANGIPTSIISGNVITQSISIQRITTGDTSLNFSLLSAVTAWY